MDGRKHLLVKAVLVPLGGRRGIGCHIALGDATVQPPQEVGIFLYQLLVSASTEHQRRLKEEVRGHRAGSGLR